MVENKLYVNEKIKEYFDNLCEGFSYVLGATSQKVNLQESEAILKAKEIKYSALISEFQKFYSTTLIKISSSKTPISKAQEKDVENKIYNLTNNAVDKLENCVRKVGHTLEAKKQKEFKLAVWCSIHDELEKSFEELKLLRSTKLSYNFY